MPEDNDQAAAPGAGVMFADDFVTIHHGDCRDVMAGMEADSIDAIVTDPPYGLSFMGRDWDHGVPGEHFWREALRVAKPGAHLVAFGGTRTYHRLAVAIEDAGWEVRDCLGWIYGSGFPKSLDVSKAIDKEAGNERPDRVVSGYAGNSVLSATLTVQSAGTPIAAAAAAWEGWGTALKPAWEPIILARKPLTGTVAGNVQRWGTGAININGCRIETDEAWNGRALPDAQDGVTWGGELNQSSSSSSHPLGRWPANIVHDGSDEVLAVFPQTTSGSRAAGVRSGMGYHGADGDGGPALDASEGSAARFFYCAKATTAERDEGIWDVPEEYEHSGPRGHSLNGDGSPRPRPRPRRNIHPTVKPVALMRWLVRLVTPPDGIVLDPFMGSGTTLIAARAEGHTSIGIDLEESHCEIAWGRMSQGVLL